MARQVLENGVILPAEYSDDWYDDMTSNLTKLDDVIGSDSEKLSSTDVGAAALSNNYNDLDNLPTIPTVNDAVLTIQKNGVDVQTFTANASSNVTANITVPTKTSDLTNDSDFVVSSNLATVATSGDYDDLSNKPSIPTNTSDLTNDSNFVDTSNSAVASGITSAKVTDYDTHIADTDIHVTTADKNRWNNQTYVFRYSSTALTASSTNSNALLDNTDNLKVGDKVIDSNGVLFSITAIDTQNSTFTIGTALIDLAQDSDVVHKSGNETIGGNKTFTDELTASRNTTNGAMLLQNASYDPKTNGQSGVSTKSFSINFLTALSDTFGSFSCFGVGDRTLLRFTSRYFVDSQTVTEDSVEYIVYGDGTRSFKPRSNNNTLLGESTRKWKEIYATNYYYGATNVEFSDKFVTSDTAQTISGNKTFSSINGVEPSSLSLPVFPSQSSWIDISSYITDMTGSVANSYTPPANGYITFSATGNQVQIFSDYGLQSKFSIQSGSIIRGYHPVLKNEPIKIYMLGTSIEFFRFIPCQGNV